MARNLRIKSKGMGWPVGSVIPASALAKGGADHVALGAVEPTDLPVTHAVALPESPPADESDAARENERLRARVRDLDGALAGAVDDLKRTRAENEKLRAENEKLWADLDAATKQADARAAAEEQARKAAGPQAAPPG